MKKIIPTILICIAMMSCSNDTEFPTEFTTVRLNAEMNSQPNLTGKLVQRGSVFASVNAIKVKNTCAEWSYTNYTDFEIVANGTVGAATAFNIDRVYSGSNVFTAKTTTTVTPNITISTRSRATGTINSANTAIKNVFTGEEAKNPYAVYTETNPVTANITIGTAQNITIPMSTKNARVIAYISLLDTNGWNAQSSIITEIYKGGTVSGGTPKTSNGFSYRSDNNQSNTNTNLISNGTKIGWDITTNTSIDGLFYMSNDTEIAGDTITFRIIYKGLIYYHIYYFTTTLKASNTGSFLIAVNNADLSIFGM
jgi:hypothetical protein